MDRDARRKRDNRNTMILAIVLGCIPAGVCVLGIAAAVAIPAFVSYTKRAKVAEAETNLQQLTRFVESRCQDGRGLPGAAGPVPATPTDRRQTPSFASDPVFAELGFAPAGGVYYAYSIVPRGDGSVALRAQGDLDGDGTLSTIEKGCYPTATGCDCSGPATRTNELE